jgi:16S rRNA (guanine(966)-N(2))-methyltransferase RsmD
MIIDSLQPEYLSICLKSMRVIAGSHRGRRLSGPEGTALRPTSDKVRQALFSILGTQVSGGRFLDLYAGSGAVGIEALSRGASAATFVESDSKAVQLLQKNLRSCQLLDRALVRVGQASTFLERKDWWSGPYDVLFADPPYRDLDELEVLIHAWRPGLLSERAIVIIEQDSRTELPASIDHAALIRRYVYGDTTLNLYAVSDAETTAI